MITTNETQARAQEYARAVYATLPDDLRMEIVEEIRALSTAELRAERARWMADFRRRQQAEEKST